MDKCSVKHFHVGYLLHITAVSTLFSVYLSQFTELCRIDWMHKHIGAQPKQEEILNCHICLYENKHTDKDKCFTVPRRLWICFPDLTADEAEIIRIATSHRELICSACIYVLLANLIICQMFWLVFSKFNRWQIKLFCSCSCILILRLEARFNVGTDSQYMLCYSCERQSLSCTLSQIPVWF